MDLAVSKKKAILVATPGQTEQEYLAERFQQKRIFASVRQDRFDLNAAMSSAAGMQGLSVDWDHAGRLLSAALDKIN
jgi:hypothetical protein